MEDMVDSQAAADRKAGTRSVGASSVTLRMTR